MIALTANANAQLCGDYPTTVKIFAADKKKIENAAIKIVPQAENELGRTRFVRDRKDFSKFVITFQEGRKLKNKYKLVITAKGFLSVEKIIEFPHCTDQNFEIYLERK